MSSPPQPTTATLHSTFDAQVIKPPDIPCSALPSPPTSPVLLAPAPTRIRLIKTPKGLKTVTILSTPSQNEPWDEGVTQSASPSLTSFAASVARTGNRHDTVTPANVGMKAKRRQSSIAYFTPSSPSPWERIEGQKHRRSMTRAGPGSVFSPPSCGRTLEGDGPLVSPSARSGAGTGEGVVLNDLSNSNSESIRERKPLTLVEKHADLLHFIAQKERKCLELREQLAVHENELVDLKRRWERIVNRNIITGGGSGYDHSVSVPSTNAASGGSALEGLKEGVRKIAAGLTDLGATDPLQKAAKPRAATHVQHESDSSVSVSADTSSGLSNWRTSTSSMSSFYDGESGGNTVNNSDEVRSSSMDAAPSVRRSASLHKRTARSRSREGSTDLQHQATAQRTDGMMHRNSLDPSPPGASQIALSSPQISNPPPSAFKYSALSTNPSSPSSLSSPSQLPTASARDVKQPRRTSLGTAFPPASSVPGLGSLAMGPSVASPVSSWIGGVGKKFGGVQGADTLSKGQKRASGLFADVSQSIMSALSSSPSLSGSVSPSPSSSTSLRTPLSTGMNVPQTNNFLDDDGEDTTQIGSVMIPDTVRPAAPAAGILAVHDASHGTGTQKLASFEDDDNWNW